MTNYTSWPIILPNMKAIKQMISEEQDSQSTIMLQIHENSYNNNHQKSHIQQQKMRDVRTNELTDKQTEKELYLLILSSAGHKKYRTVIAIPNNISKSQKRGTTGTPQIHIFECSLSLIAAEELLLPAFLTVELSVFHPFVKLRNTGFQIKSNLLGNTSTV